MKLKISVTNEDNRKLFCKAVLKRMKEDTAEASAVIMDIVYLDGEHVFDIKEGRYCIEVYRGKLFEPFKTVLETGSDDLALEVKLKEMLNAGEMGLYSFDAHSHISRDETKSEGNLEAASGIMKAEAFNFFFAGSPYDPETHWQYLNRKFTDKLSYRHKYASLINAVNDETFMLDIGNELVKCRYGHIFMMGYDQMPPFSKYYDEEFDPWLFTKPSNEPPYSIAFPYEAVLASCGENSVAIAAHPTSWWWHNGEFITNIAATFGFDILAGTVEALVIMGYESDKKYYQELWYEALNNGYFMPGVAETDAAFDTIPGKKLQFKTYTYLEDFSIDALCTSVKAGRNIATSGPLILLKVNESLPGTVLQYAVDEEFAVSIEAFRCCEASLSKVQIIINGNVYREYEMDDDNCRMEERICFDRDSYIIAKCYDHAGNVAIANPVYIRNNCFVNRDYRSKATVNVKSKGEAVVGSYWLDGDDTRIPFTGRIKLDMKITSNLNICHGGCTKTVRLFELEELQRIFKNLYLGRFNNDKRFAPGEVPACEFKLAEIRKILDNVEIDVDF